MKMWQTKYSIKFKDAVGRKFSFPFELCHTWAVRCHLLLPFRRILQFSVLQGMEELIRRAFLNIDGLGPHVHEGHYDLLDQGGGIILPQVWETVIEPDSMITMHMWPMPEPPQQSPPPKQQPPSSAGRQTLQVVPPNSGQIGHKSFKDRYKNKGRSQN